MKGITFLRSMIRLMRRSAWIKT